MTTKPRKCAFPISKWKKQGVEFTESESGERKIAEYIIGTSTIGDDSQAIYERIFVDVFNLIQKKQVTVHINLYADPVMVVEKNGKFIPHSPDDTILRDDIDDVIDISNDGNRLRALTEIRKNMYNAATLGDVTRNLREQITNALPAGYFQDGNALSYDFLKLYLREKYRLNDLPEEGSLKEIIRDYSKAELIELYGGMLEYASFGKASYEPLKSLLEQGYKPEEIEMLYYEELSRRFFIGDIN